MIDHSSGEYRSAVERALAGVENELVFNGTIDHAKVVIEEAFKAAKRHVRILSHHLEPACYDDSALMAAAEAFLRRPDAELDVLIEAPREMRPDQRFLPLVKSVGGQRVRACVVPEEYVKTYTFNFLTVDETAFRFEDERSKPIGVVAGGPRYRDTVNHLITVFEELFQKSSAETLTLTPA